MLGAAATHGEQMELSRLFRMSARILCADFHNCVEHARIARLPVLHHAAYGSIGAGGGWGTLSYFPARDGET